MCFSNLPFGVNEVFILHSKVTNLVISLRICFLCHFWDFFCLEHFSIHFRLFLSPLCLYAELLCCSADWSIVSMECLGLFLILM